MPTEVKAWKGKDGRLHESYEAAYRTELKHEFRAAMTKYDKSAQDSAWDLIDGIIEDPQPALDALNKYVEGLE